MTAVVHHGDALAILPTLPAGSVDAVVADPPYCSGGVSATERRMKSTRAKYATGRRGDLVHELDDFVGDNRDQRGWAYWCAMWLSECLRLTVPGGSLLMWTDWRQLPTATDVVQAAGWTWRGVLVWGKPAGRARPVRGGFRSQAEFLVWATAGPLRRDHEVYLDGLVLTTAPHAAARQHQTEKPAAMLRNLVQVAPRGGMILDPFAGSGSTGAAALAEGRRFVGIEQSTRYAQVARARVAEAERALTLPAGP